MSELDTTMPNFDVHPASVNLAPEWGGQNALSLNEFEALLLVMHNDDFIFVTAGTTQLAVEGGETSGCGPDFQASHE